jgi:UDP-N-acetylglucosamine--N-acetylmuramyl-(pentapeptide) pyrophosphoryl-undecaprenol N-acetylglucosamine transferase
MRIVLSGGGTGGHIYPAVAIARECRHRMRDCELLYIGTKRGLESTIVPKEQIPFESIDITGFKRKLSLDNLKTVIRFVKGVRRSSQLLRQFKPDIVVGTGGYVCGPVVYAAAKMGIPTVIHEQNVIPGLTNVFLSRYASVVAVSFQGGEQYFPKAKKAVFTGNPRATEVYRADKQNGYASLGLPQGSRIVLVVGGSRGARVLNETMIAMAGRLRSLPEIRFVYVTGEHYYDNTIKRIQDTLGTMPDNLTIKPYVHNMPEVLAATSLVVGRAGASSLAEITSLGIPSILIPSPNVTNNHQTANAKQLKDAGAAEMFLESELTGDLLFASIRAIMSDSARWKTMAEKAKSLGQPDAAKRIVDEMSRLIRSES